MDKLYLGNKQPLSAYRPIQEAQYPEDKVVSSIAQATLKRELGLNFLRDWLWGALSLVNIGPDGRGYPDIPPALSLDKALGSGAFLQPTLAQWSSCTLLMFAAATAEIVYRKYKGVELAVTDYAKILAPAIAASIAIPMWNMGASIGAHLAHAGSATLGALSSAAFAGIFEGFTQFTVKYIIDVATNTETQEMWRKDPFLMCKVLMKDILVNATLGALPGAVWKIVFFAIAAALLAALGPVGAAIVAGLVVALCVMLSNYIFGDWVNKVSEKINTCLGWDVQLELLRNKAELGFPEEEIPIQDYNKSFFGLTDKDLGIRPVEKQLDPPQKDHLDFGLEIPDEDLPGDFEGLLGMNDEDFDGGPVSAYGRIN